MADEVEESCGCVDDRDDEDEHKMKSSSLLPWDRFSSWIHCICIVTFDLELGQALEVSRNMTCI
jgi:hypothetical protein